MGIAPTFPKPVGFVITAVILSVLTDFTDVGGIVGDNFGDRSFTPKFCNVITT